MNRIERQRQPERKPEERIKDFVEVTSPFPQEIALIEASRCLQCKNAPCIKGCPAGINIPGFIKKIKEGDMKGAIDIIHQNSNLPGVCGRVCTQEEQCEKNCVRGRLEGAVAIGALERYTADYDLKNFECECTKSDGSLGKVAIVGSGPAGLAAASELARAGAQVTIFEAFHKAGGVLVYGIPEFRLPKEIVEKEIDNMLKLGVELRLNTVIGKTITQEELMSNYDAVFIGSGAGLPKFMGIEGENLNGVFSANEYLTRVNLMRAYNPEYDTPVWAKESVAVFGAGNVAMDSARTALRLGAKKVTIIYRRTIEESPAREEEILHAQQEGVEFMFLTQPVKILGENGLVKGIECVRCELGEPDASGRRSPVEIEGSNFVVDADMVIVAIGTSPNPLLPKVFKGLKVTPRGTIVVDENHMTSIDRVYAGGDAVTGAATVILAIGAGKKAAEAIIERLRKEKEEKSK